MFMIFCFSDGEFEGLEIAALSPPPGATGRDETTRILNRTRTSLLPGHQVINR